MNYYISTITKNYANFGGRARRKEYWMFFLFNVIVGLVLGVIVAVTQLAILPSIYSLLILIPSLALTIRRLHDVDKGGIWLLIGCVPLIGWIWLLVLVCKEGTPGTNQYGVNPKER